MLKCVLFLGTAGAGVLKCVLCTGVLQSVLFLGTAGAGVLQSVLFLGTAGAGVLVHGHCMNGQETLVRQAARDLKMKLLLCGPEVCSNKDFTKLLNDAKKWWVQLVPSHWNDSNETSFIY